MMKIEWVTGTPYMVLNEGGTLLINYERWMDLSKTERKALLEHEHMHNVMAAQHPAQQGWYVTVRRRTVEDTTVYVQAANAEDACAAAEEKVRTGNDLFWDSVSEEFEAIQTEVHNG